MVGPDEQLDVGLNIQGIVEHAFHHYDMLMGDDVEHHEGTHEAEIPKGDVHPSEEIWPNSGQAKNVDATNIVGMPCKVASIEDQEDDG